jgi:hypothetical protein
MQHHTVRCISSCPITIIINSLRLAAHTGVISLLQVPGVCTALFAASHDAAGVAGSRAADRAGGRGRSMKDVDGSCSSLCFASLPSLCYETYVCMRAEQANPSQDDF